MDEKGSFSTSLQAFLKEKEPPEEWIHLGEHKLLQGRLSEALSLFQQVEALIGHSRADLYYRIALALFEYGSEEGHEKTLFLVNKKLKKAHAIQPHVTEILHTWGNVLCQMGENEEQTHFFLLAKEKYEKALKLGEHSVELFWDYAVVWYHIGNFSEEAMDLQKAMQYFWQVSLESKNLPSQFWIDYGSTALLLSTKINSIQWVEKAMHCFRCATLQDKNCFESWSGLAEALEMLYRYTHEEDIFFQANESFATASKLAPQESDHLLDWAKFLLYSAKKNADIGHLRACLEKCYHAYACNTENAMILATWAEALALLGQMTEKLDLIYEAENKITKALELDEEDPEIWHSFGMCLCSFGVYFSDYDYFYQAIEKFQIGLSIDRSYDPLWHAIANAYAIIGTWEEDFDVLIQSFKFYEKSLSFSHCSTRHIDYAKALSKLGEITGQQKWLEQSLWHFETAFSMQKNAMYLHPDWIFFYASTLDLIGDFHEDEKYYIKAIELFSHIFVLDPNFPKLHHRLAQVFCHLGDLLGDTDTFYRAIRHLRLGLKQEEENDAIILDWGIVLIHIAKQVPLLTDIEPFLYEAEQKLTHAARLGNIQAYYYLSCLFSLKGHYEKAMHFLQKADAFQALPLLEELLEDEWLDGLRSTLMFQEFLAEHPNLH